jgi:hypothetical protein
LENRGNLIKEVIRKNHESKKVHFTGHTNNCTESEKSRRYLSYNFKVKEDGILRLQYSLSLSVSLSLFLSLALQPFAGPWPLFSFLIFYAGGRTPLDGGSARSTEQHKQNKGTRTSTPWVGFEPTLPLWSDLQFTAIHNFGNSAVINHNSNYGLCPFQGNSDGLRDGRRGFDCRQYEIFLFSTASRPILKPTQPPIQWVLGTLSPGNKR